MGNPKQKWTAEEEEALRAGVAKHGAGKWKNIQRDPEFNRLLFFRSNIDLKDKWRNMSVSAGGQNPREKSRTSKHKSNSNSPVAAKTPSNAQSSATVSDPVKQDTSAETPIDDSAKSSYAKSAPKYNLLIIEAITSMKEPNGSDISSIVGYIKQRQEVPQNFRKLLSSRLRRLVAQDQLEKVKNCYKVKSNAPVVTKAPPPKPKDVRPKQLLASGYINTTETIEDAAVAAAYKIAEAENKSFVAAEAVKEAERIAKMAEDSESFLLFAKEVFEKCNANINNPQFCCFYLNQCRPCKGSVFFLDRFTRRSCAYGLRSI
ncbi:SANT/Myb domain [Dillenia turbinata]|uniref:MYB transcription factor n=1 Tax=Dillenia turbinata TaxID=194707 RepID=A0AAN8VW65_9MAGN